MPTRGINAVYRVGTGAADSPVILHVPHSSRHITPAARRGILLDDAALAVELDHVTDSHTSLIAELLQAGALGYVLKSDAKQLLIPAVETVAAHQPFFTGVSPTPCCSPSWSRAMKTR